MSQQRAFLESEHVGVRPYSPADNEKIHQWLNDERVTYFMYYGQRPTTLAQVTDMMAKQWSNEANVLFVVETVKGKRPIGFAGLYDIHPTARKGEFRVLIGDPACWGKGWGTEVTELLTHYAFDRLNLNRVWLGVTDENKGAVRAYEKSGYRVEGVLKQDTYRNSRYYDTVRMGILRSDYYPKRFEENRKRFGLRPAGKVRS